MRIGLRSARRLVLVVADYLPALGGTTTQVRAHAVEFQRAGWDVTVLTKRRWGSLGSERLDGVEVRRVGIPGGGILAKGCHLVSCWGWLLLRNHRIARVSTVLEPDYAVACVCAGLGSKTVHTWVTDGDASRSFFGVGGHVRRFLLGPVRHVVLTSRMGVELSSVASLASVCIPVPVDCHVFTAPDPALRSAIREKLELAERCVVVFVGHVEFRKGVDALLDACDLLLSSGRGIALVVVGGAGKSDGGAYYVGLRRRSNEMGMQGVVRWVGPRLDVRPYLACADILCLPSRREGMPNVLLEAMASGVPCVAPSSAGGEELLSDGCGVIPRSSSPKSIAESLAFLCDHPEERLAIGRRALNRVASDNRPSVIAMQYDFVWESMKCAVAPFVD